MRNLGVYFSSFRVIQYKNFTIELSVLCATFDCYFAAGFTCSHLRDFSSANLL